MKLLIGFCLCFAVLLGLISGVVGGYAAIIVFMLIFPVVFILRDFRVGVVGILLLLPLANITLLGHIPGLNPANVAIMLSFGAFLLAKVTYWEDNVKLPRIIWWRYILPIVLAAGVGLTHLGEVTPLMLFHVGEDFASKSSYVVSLCLKPLLFITAAWLIGNAVRDSRQPERYLAAFALSAVLLSAVLLGFIVWRGEGLSVISSARARTFLSPLGLHANEFGAMFATAFGVLLFIMPAVRLMRYRLLLGATIAIVLVALLLTFSRGGYVCAMVATGYFMFSQRRVKLALASGALLIVVALLAPQAVQDRIMTGLGGGAEASRDVMSSRTSDDELTAGRMWMWRQTFPTFYRNPITGSGLASQAWSDAVKRGVVHTAATHNLYLSILYDTGVVGMVLVMSFFIFVYRNFRQLAQAVSTPPLMAAAMQGAAASLLGYGVMAFTNSRFWPQSDQVYLWFMFGISLAYVPALNAAKAGSQPAQLRPA